MNSQQITTMIAKAIVAAYDEAHGNLESTLSNPNIVQPAEHIQERRRIELENCFFEMVTAYQPLLSRRGYELLCQKLELMEHRFVYRP